METNEIKTLLTTELETVKAAVVKVAETNTAAEIKKMSDLVDQKFAALNTLPADVQPAMITKAVADIKQLVEDWASMEKLVKDGRFAANGTEGKNFQEAFAIAAKENADKIQGLKKGESISLDLKDMTFGNAFTTAGASVTYVKPGIIELPKRKLHIRELLPGGSMGANSTFDFVKEITGSGSPIAPTAEGALKPQFGLALEETSVKAQWIAGFMKMSVNLLNDVEGMTTFLQSRLPEKLLRVEDEQILNGNGVGSNLLGIQSVGNYTAAAVAVTNRAETLVNAISQLENLDREANGILLNPADWYNLWLYKAATSGEYTLPVNLVEKIGSQMFIAGVPVFRSTAQTTFDYLVGDWNMGANFITREPARVEFFREDGTNVQTNQVTVRIEERVALPVYGNDYFIYGTFDAVS
jgi:HK97 family phage major capsid protein